ncbi:hypothetical protein WA026_020190 [Henosepilachna vigintioctopunctata]|uniref:Caspase-3 n=1 Tax=Henosepilachna vigintioctopunctata TaxID=420089 RepID=A0AAW1U629_9CUCU
MSSDIEQDAIGFSLNPRESSSTNAIDEGPFSTRYNMKHSKRGLAIIFNHKHFKMHNLKTRQGTDKDKEDLEALFKNLKFDVKCYDDLDRLEVEKVLVSVSAHDHSEEDCLVVAVLSHGDNKKIFARDTYYPPDMLWKYFNGNESPSLIGKPKLFFIQACRGEKIVTPVRVLQRQALTEVDSIQEDKSASYSIPVIADILVMYSTLEDHLSWRNPINGSYFIQSLIRQLSTHADKKDLLSILTYVNREVAVGYSEEMREQNIIGYAHKQMSSIVSMLTREVYF